MKNEYRKWISRKIRQIRENRDLTAKQVAESLGMNDTTYLAYELGRAEPSIYNLERICKILEISIGEFLIDSPNSIR